jgi:hypothetical protein
MSLKIENSPFELKIYIKFIEPADSATGKTNITT